MDINGNGYLSLAEIDKGLKNKGEKMKVIYLAKPALMRAFNAARDSVRSEKNSVEDDYVTKAEFRIFNLYLRQYFEYFMMFKNLDKNNDNKITI